MNSFRLFIILFLVNCIYSCSEDSLAETKKILFIEQHSITNGILISGPEPPLLMVDFPMYSYNEEENKLEGWIEFEIEPELLVIYGSGGCLSGTAGAGCGTGLTACYEIPFVHGRFQLLSIDSDENISGIYKNEIIELSPGEEWISKRVFPDTSMVDGQLSISEITVTDKLVHWGTLEKPDIIPWK